MESPFGWHQGLVSGEIEQKRLESCWTPNYYSKQIERGTQNLNLLDCGFLGAKHEVDKQGVKTEKPFSNRSRVEFCRCSLLITIWRICVLVLREMMVEEKSRTKHHWVYNWKGEEPLWTLILLRLSLEECWPNQFQERSPLKGCRRHLIGFKRDPRPITSCHSVSGRSFRCPEIQRSCLGDHSCRERPRLRARFVKKHFSIGKCQDNISDDFWSIFRSDTMVMISPKTMQGRCLCYV